MFDLRTNNAHGQLLGQAQPLLQAHQPRRRGRFFPAEKSFLAAQFLIGFAEIQFSADVKAGQQVNAQELQQRCNDVDAIGPVADHDITFFEVADQAHKHLQFGGAQGAGGSGQNGAAAGAEQGDDSQVRKANALGLIFGGREGFSVLGGVLEATAAAIDKAKATALQELAGWRALLGAMKTSGE